IFDRFRQAESASARTQGGLGLGLAIVRHLVELHGGRVAAFSAGEGRGATFTVELPLGAATRAQREDEARSASDRPTGDARLDGLRVLVVEDDVDTERLLAQILADRGADVVAVATAAAALAAVGQHHIHVIVSDIGLPGADGYELIRRVRALPGDDGVRIPAIALTAFAREEDMRRAIGAGFDAHLAKPIDPAELARTNAQLARS